MTITDGAGAVNVICDSGCGGAASFEDNDAFVADTTPVNVMGALYDTTPPAVTDGNAGSVRMNSNRQLMVDGSGVTQPVSGTVNIGTFPDNEPFNVGQINGVTPLMGAGNTGTGSQRVTEATDSQLSAGVGATGDAAATVGSTGSLNAKLRLITSQLDAITTELGQKTEPANTQTTGEVPVTSGGLSISRTVSAASTNATNVKASAGQVYNIQVSSVNAAARYLHLFNNSGTPTCNASIISTHIIPGNAAGAGTNIVLAPGVAFGTGIAFCLTTAVDGTGSVSASEHVVMISYK